MPVLAGILVGVAYFPGPFLPLNLAGFLPLLFWLETRPDAPATERLVAGFAFGLTTHLVAEHWQYSMLDSSWLAVVLYLFMSAALGLRIALSVALLGWLRQRTRLPWALLLPLCWLPFEWIQTWGDLRMTGEHLAHTIAGYPFLVQFADLVGPYGVGAFVLAVNGLIFEARSMRRRPSGRRAALVLSALVLVVLAYDAWSWVRPRPDLGTITIGIVQPDVSLGVKHGYDTEVEQWAQLAEMTREAAHRGARLVVWPESAYPYRLRHVLERPETYRVPEISALARDNDVALLVGVEYSRITDAKHFELYNAALAFEADGTLLPHWAAKSYLVPFVEGTPFRSLLGPLVEGRGGEWRWLSGGFQPGPKSGVLDVAGTRVGVLVCYEQMFFELARGLRNNGAELGIVITNDAWFGRSLFQPYLANALRLRAIESRMAFVRVANTGISGFVDQRGRYHERTELFERAVAVHDVARTRQPTVYDRTGDLVAWLAVAGLLAAVLAATAAARTGTGGRLDV